MTVHILTDYSLRTNDFEKLYNIYFKSLQECEVIIIMQVAKWKLYSSCKRQTWASPCPTEMCTYIVE